MSQTFQGTSTFSICIIFQFCISIRKKPGRPKKTWDEVLVDDKKMLGMVSTDPQNRSEWKGRLRGRLVQTSPTLGRGKQALNWI